MKKITALLTALLLIGTLSLALGGCGENEHVARAKKIEKKACSCKDMKCVKEVQKMITTFQKEAGDKKVTKSDGEKIKKAMKNAAQCMIKAMTGKAKKK